MSYMVSEIILSHEEILFFTWVEKRCEEFCYEIFFVSNERSGTNETSRVSATTGNSK
jgi:hypothetical protein